MTDVLEQLRKAVGDPFVLSGSQVHADYTHDEALTARPVTPRAVVLPGVDGRGRRDPADGEPAADPRGRPGQRHRALGLAAFPCPTAS